MREPLSQPFAPAEAQLLTPSDVVQVAPPAVQLCCLFSQTATFGEPLG